MELLLVFKEPSKVFRVRGFGQDVADAVQRAVDVMYRFPDVSQGVEGGRYVGSF